MAQIIQQEATPEGGSQDAALIISHVFDVLPRPQVCSFTSYATHIQGTNMFFSPAVI